MIQNLIKDSITLALKNLYDMAVVDIPLEHPNIHTWGDFSSNVALVIAKDLKQSPYDIAKNICYEINTKPLSFVMYTKEYDMFEEIYAAPPGFINFKLSRHWLYNVLEMIQAAQLSYGSSSIGAKTRIALEHSNVNPNKAAHIGHLRNACLGQFIEKIYEFLGYSAEVQYYANDVGVQVATLQMGLKYITNLSESSYEKFDQYAWDVYSTMESMVSENPDLQKERSDLMVKIDDVKSIEFSNQSKIADKVLKSQLKTFSNLGIDYDVVIHERDVLELKLWEAAFERLKKNPNVYLATEGKSKGCWLVSMEDEENPNSVDEDPNSTIEKDKIIVRSNGVPTYTGKDIAYHMWKFGLLDMDFNYELLDVDTQSKPLWTTTSNSNNINTNISFSNVDKVFDVIGGEQTYAIDVVKTALRYLGFEDAANNMKHINYGFVYLSPKTAKKLGIDISDGKKMYGMSGRRGWGIKIDDFIAMLDDSLMADFGWYESLPQVRNGAIKFEMLKRNTFQDLIFDLDDALSITGYSGPYIQYTHARATSILKKSQMEETIYFSTGEIDDIAWQMNEKEVSVLRELYQFPEIVQRSALEFAPNLLCEYLFNLSKAYNTFYNDIQILSIDNYATKNFRVLLTRGVQTVLRNGLGLLGIDSPEKM